MRWNAIWPIHPLWAISTVRPKFKLDVLTRKIQIWPWHCWQSSQKWKHYETKQIQTEEIGLQRAHSAGWWKNWKVNQLIWHFSFANFSKGQDHGLPWFESSSKARISWQRMCVAELWSITCKCFLLSMINYLSKIMSLNQEEFQCRSI